MLSIPCDIALLPEPGLAQKAINTSEQLRQFGAQFTLNAKTGPFPHISLYMTQLSPDRLDEAKKLLAGISAQTLPIDLVCKGYGNPEGYIDADYVRTKTIEVLQIAVVNAINPIRDGMREKDKARMLAATGKVRESLEKYGYRSVGELYRPHMTFTRFADEQTAAVDTLPEPITYSGKFIRLGLFEMGDNGTCAKEIISFTLGQ